MTSGALYGLELAYLGTDFHGWQSQPSGRGIQNEVERALGVFLRHETRVMAASRTDTGVHAEHQVCTFRTPVDFNEHRWTQGLNGLLTSSVRVRKVAHVSDSFHPIRSAVGKAYRYRIWNSSVDHPFFAQLCWRVNAHLDLAAMKAASDFFLGEHDFTSFCASDSSAKTKIRRILEIKIERRGDLIDVWFVGEGFLKQMVRNLVGALVETGEGKIKPEAIAAMLEARDRTVAPKTAPARGLCLVKIFYDEIHSVESLVSEASRGFTLSV